jgi:hypothetical protein
MYLAALLSLSCNIFSYDLPSLSTAQQSDRWSNLMPLMSWQLWLAKDLVEVISLGSLQGTI